jgi:hypothetical protein
MTTWRRGTSGAHSSGRGERATGRWGTVDGTGVGVGIAMGRMSRDVVAGAGAGVVAVGVATGARSFVGFLAGRDPAFLRGAAGVRALAAFAAGRRAGAAFTARAAVEAGRTGAGVVVVRVAALVVAAFADLAALTTSAEGLGAAAVRRGRPFVACPSCEPSRLRLDSSSPSTS